MAPRRDGHAADDRCFVCAVFSVEGAWGASLRSVKAMGTMADRSSSSLASSLTCWRRGTGETRSAEGTVILVGEAALCIIRTTRRRPSMEALSIIMVSEVRPGPGLSPKSAPLHVLGMSSSVPSSARSKAAWGRRLRGEREAGRPGAPPHEDGTESRLRPPKHQPFSCLAARVRRACRERVRAASRLALTCVLTLLPHPRPSSSSLEESGSTGAAV